ncbi:DUF6053 domain-containing protein [Lysobacter yananisis]|uniref:DUF6053 domain-containing protein n=1 Tax=Lysobacter yananisis TaxID=1003114 RepID=UPI003CE569BC
MGGTSVPMLSVWVAATRPKSVGTEVPPTRADVRPVVLWEGLSAPTPLFRVAAIQPGRSPQRNARSVTVKVSGSPERAAPLKSGPPLAVTSSYGNA